MSPENPAILAVLVCFFLAFLSIGIVQRRSQNRRKRFDREIHPGLKEKASQWWQWTATIDHLSRVDPGHPLENILQLKEAALQAFNTALAQARSGGFRKFLEGKEDPSDFLTSEETAAITEAARNTVRREMADRMPVTSVTANRQGGQPVARNSAPDDAKRIEEIRQKQDEFLDAYINWKATHRIAERTKLLDLARELQELDPSFKFTLPD